VVNVLLIAVGVLGVVVFAFLSWRSLGGSQRNPDAHDLAASAPSALRWAGRVSALVAMVGFVRLFI
jgi:hypothetical protein